MSSPIAVDRSRRASTAETHGERARAPGTSAFAAVVVLGVYLRVWRALHNGPSFDESFTAIAGRRPVGDLVEFLARHDSHPPLDYLLRLPLSRAGAGDFWLRAPSIVFSCAALGLFAWWMHTRGWFGLFATSLFACSTFQVLHGGEARMYALLQVVGVGAAVVAEGWLRAPRAWRAWALAGLLLVALSAHASGLLLALGLVVLAGRRTDRDAWTLRASLAAVGFAWAVLWLPTMVDQVGRSWSDWVPRTSPSGFARAVGEQLMTVRGTPWLLLGATVAGAVVLVGRDARLGQVWLALGAVPFAAAAAIGLASPFLLPRTLTLASWTPVLAIAALLDAVRRRWDVYGGAAAIAVPVLVLLATINFLAGKIWDYDLSIAQLERSARPGDLIAVRPARYGVLVDWRIGVRGEQPTRDAAVPIVDTDARRVVGAERSGRIWLLTPLGSATRFDGFEPCAPPWDDGVTTIVCMRPSGP